MEVAPSSLEDDAVARSENAIVFSGHTGTAGGKICGPTNEMRIVSKFEETPALSAQLVASVQGAVGRAYPNNPSVNGETSCTGVLVANNIFMVSALCWPGGLGSVTFNDQPLTAPLNNVLGVIEGTPDWNRAAYRLLALSGNPGVQRPIARIATHMPSGGEQIFMIQHPYGPPVTTNGSKVIDTGFVRSVEAYLDGFPNEGLRITYDDIDAELGSSGAPIFDATGSVIGIAEAGDCNVAGGFNYASMMREIDRASERLGGTDTLTLGLANETFSTSEALSNVDGSFIPVSGDFDNDSFEDIFFYAPGTTPDQLWWGTADQRFSRQDFVVDGGFYQPFVGNFDGDTFDDIFFYEPSKPSEIWYGSGNRGFKRITVTVKGTFQPVAGDFNGDGRDDIFWYRRNQPNAVSHAIWLGQPTQTFLQSSFTETGNHVIVAGNFDGDCCSDLLVQQPDDTGWGRIHFGGTKRMFTRSFSLNDLPRYLTPFPGDFDGDGRDDVLFWGPAEIQVPMVYYMDGFDAEGRLKMHTTTFGGGVRSTYINTPVIGRFDSGNARDDIYWYRPG